MSAATLARLLLTFCASALLMLTPVASVATSYECNTEQALKWEHGKLVPDTNYLNHEVLLFDDETGILSVALKAGSVFDPIHLKIVEPGSELTAVSTYSQGFVGNNLFHLRTWDKASGISFLFYSDSPNEITTGKCHIDEPYPYVHQPKASQSIKE
jgi:hypothetical protein